MISQRSNRQRLQELDSACHPHDKSQISFIENEKLALSGHSSFRLYLRDKWNYYDILSIVLLLAVIFTHVADVVNHSEAIARAHIRVFSVTIVFISMRIFESGRVIFEVGLSIGLISV